MQQRYYDQGVGRFLSVDPVSASSINGGNFNRYWYASNNPYRFVDPDGREAKPTKRDFRSICDRQPRRCEGYKPDGKAGNSGGGGQESPPLAHTPTVSSRSELPSVGTSVGYPSAEGFTGTVEGWRKTKELIAQGVIWEVVPEADWVTIPLGGLRSLLRRPKPKSDSVQLARTPDLQVARQQGRGVLYRQVGYVHVVSFFDHGVLTGEAEKPGGRGLIWTKEVETEGLPSTDSKFVWRIN